MANMIKAIEHMTGLSVDDDAKLLRYAQEAVREMAGRLDEPVLWPFVKELADTGSGVDIQNARVLNAAKNGCKAREVSFSHIGEIKYSEDRPVFYRKGTLGFVLPDGGTVFVAEWPTVTFNGDSGLPEMYEEAIIRYVAKAMLEDEARRLRETLPDAITAVLPDLPVPPVFNYSPVTPQIADLVSVGSVKVPAYIAKFSTITGLSSWGTDVSVDYTAWEAHRDDENDEMMRAIAERLGITIAEFRASREFKQAFDALVQQGEVATIQRQLREASDRAQVDVGRFQGELQKAIEDARLTYQRSVEFRQRTTQAELANEAQELERQVQQYGQHLARYRAILERWGADVSRQVQEAQIKLQSTGSRIELIRREAARVFSMFQQALSNLRNTHTAKDDLPIRLPAI